MQAAADNIVWVVSGGTLLLLAIVVAYILLLVTSYKRIGAEQKAKLEEITKSEEKYRNLFDNSLAGIIKFSLPDWKIIDSNAAIRAIFACSSQEELQQCFMSVRSAMPASLGKEFRGENFFVEREMCATRKDGVEVWVSFSTKMMDGGRIAQAVVIDTTKRREIERRNHLLAQAFVSAKDCICITDLDERIVIANPSFADAYGYSPEELAGKSILKITRPEVDNPNPELVTAALSAGWHGELTNRKKDGTEFPVELWMSVVKNELQEPVALLGVSRDITFRKLAEEELRRTEEQFRELVENLNDLIFTLDAEGNLKYVNQAVRRAFGFEPSEIMGSPFLTFVHPEDRGHSTEGFLQAISSRRQGLEFRIVDKQGKTRFVRTSSHPEFENGKVVAISGILTDITESKERLRAEEQSRLLESQARELEDARETAIRAADLKSEFMANMSHEIRTPLNGVLGAADMLKRTPLDVRQQGFVDIINRSGDALLSLINDILDFSKIEAGKLALESVQFSVRSLVEQALEIVGENARRKGLALKHDISKDIPERLIGDPSRLRQILLNLLSNAIKFTNEGHVILRVVPKTVERDLLGLQFSVCDTGIGISQEALSRLFQPFTQADGSTTRKYGGTGLGLSISKRITELMNGTIGVESSIGVGSTFWIQVPILIAVDQRQSVPDQPPLSRRNPNVYRNPAEPADKGTIPQHTKRQNGSLASVLRVLVVEDMEVNQVVLTSMLQELGCQVDLATNGREAIEAVQATSFDIVFMDCHLPEIDGWEATAHIRSWEGDKPQGMIIVAMTADALEGDKERCFAAGMDDYVAKPCKLVDLQRVILKWTGKQPPSGTPAIPKSDVKPIDPDVIDQARICELRSLGGRGESNVLTTILQKYLNDGPGQLADIRSAFAVGEWLKLRDINHKLNGTSANVGAKRVSKLCSTLSENVRNGSLEAAAQTIDRLCLEFEETREVLTRQLSFERTQDPGAPLTTEPVPQALPTQSNAQCKDEVL